MSTVQSVDLSAYEDVAYGMGKIDGRRDGEKDFLKGVVWIAAGSNQYVAGYRAGYRQRQEELWKEQSTQRSISSARSPFSSPA